MEIYDISFQVLLNFQEISIGFVMTYLCLVIWKCNDIFLFVGHYFCRSTYIVKQKLIAFWLVCFEENVELSWSLDLRHLCLCCCRCAKTFISPFTLNVLKLSTFEILAHQDKVQLHDKRHNSESYSFGVMLLFD